MGNLTDRGYLRELMEKNGFSFSKGLGQNFIVNPSVYPRIAEMGGAGPGVGVLEIGPGVGVLTAELCRRAEKVAALEIDSRLIPILGETLKEFRNLTVLNEDVLKADLAGIIAREFPGLEVVVCANLPYYITSPILMSLLERRLPIRAVTVMVQKEAAQRICAAPGSREAGAISCAVRYYSEPRILFQVSRGSFMPAPEVDSAVIRLDIRPAPPVEVADEADVETVQEIFQARIDSQLSGGAMYPATVEAWQNAQVLVNGNVVALIAAGEMQSDAVAAFNGLF